MDAYYTDECHACQYGMDYYACKENSELYNAEPPCLQGQIEFESDYRYDY